MINLHSNLGLSDYDDECQQPTVSEQLCMLAERIDNVTVCKETLNYPEPKTKFENKAFQLVEHLTNNVVPRNG